MKHMADLCAFFGEEGGGPPAGRAAMAAGLAVLTDHAASPFTSTKGTLTKEQECNRKLQADIGGQRDMENIRFCWEVVWWIKFSLEDTCPADGLRPSPLSRRP